MNTTTNASTGYSPFRLVYGQEPLFAENAAAAGQLVVLVNVPEWERNRVSDRDDATESDMQLKKTGHALRTKGEGQ